jgi:hypothetical protein
MPMNARLAAGLLLVLVGSFAIGLYTLFSLRFETGDIFPPYSSLRTDPLGVKAFYEALERLPGHTPGRHFRDLSKLGTAEPTTLLYLGLKPDFLTRTPPGLVDQMETLVQRGTRLVLAFQLGRTKPAFGKGRRRKPKAGAAGESEKAAAKPQEEGNTTEKGNATTVVPQHLATRKWELRPAYAGIPKGVKQGARQASRIASEEGLPATISLHTALYFHRLGDAWRVIYAVAEQPVVIERSMGTGSIVLVADSFLFSNEAMRDERYPGLLAWLIGKNPATAFDEYHLGVSERPGVMTLMRQYRLHGVLAALLLVACLLVWRDAVALTPKRTENPSRRAESVAGKDQLQGLINLLRRNLEPAKLLPTCFAEWKKSLGRDCRGRLDQLQRISSLIETPPGKSFRSEDAVAIYRRIAQILSERTFQ